MLTTFLLWALTGFVAVRKTESLALGLLGGCWSAVLSVLMVVTCGFVLMFFEVPPVAYVATWPEFKQSGWTDVQAFAIANTLEAGFTHILAGFVMGCFFGGSGGCLGRILTKRSCWCHEEKEAGTK
jgi:hypothetical protein